MANSKIKSDNMDFLFDCILSLQSMDECYDFFEDLCTVNELQAISQRIVVAKMLSEKRVYSDIVKETGASTATISRVNRSLQFGCNGYEKLFERVAARKKDAQ
ncbi:MAG: YerC/YecD family TrpR-related protein [Candidatus Fimenecus sp.]|nr:YerC/YecD family TrpR-related protein [Ruminococcus sp.]MDO4155134.1 YerC/YecD family TrpR-related protein [Clostridia bacterium]